MKRQSSVIILPVLAHQEITWDWWPVVRKKYDPYISEIVIEEVSKGDSGAAAKRLEFIQDFPLLELTDKVERMANTYFTELQFSEKMFRDTLHLAFASVHNIDYLVTCNCAHIANVEIRRKLESINERYDLQTPLICTPEEIGGGYHFVERPDS